MKDPIVKKGVCLQSVPVSREEKNKLFRKLELENQGLCIENRSNNQHYDHPLPLSEEDERQYRMY